ncbi:MAG TPA: sulfite exporter TauE/SafE family protein, partial [Haliangium sp.]|nr:sulfite exporter TauE/SafE family protein [Haliangium sp.]
GGGSMLTLPVLMLLGLPADVANGTNRPSVVTQAVAGMLGFRTEGKLDERALALVIAPTVAGALLGSISAARMPPALLEHVLLGTMMTMAVVMTVFPGAVTAPPDAPPATGGRRVAGIAGLFAAGLYGGFVQAGVGFLLLGALSGLLRYDLVRANALKLACVAVFGIAALIVFVIAGQVAWLPAVVLAAGTAAGSRIGVRFALRVRHDVLRYIVLACVIATCVAALLDR